MHGVLREVIGWLSEQASEAKGRVWRFEELSYLRWVKLDEFVALADPAFI